MKISLVEKLKRKKVGEPLKDNCANETQNDPRPQNGQNYNEIQNNNNGQKEPEQPLNRLIQSFGEQLTEVPVIHDRVSAEHSERSQTHETTTSGYFKRKDGWFCDDGRAMALKQTKKPTGISALPNRQDFGTNFLPDGVANTKVFVKPFHQMSEVRRRRFLSDDSKDDE